MKNIISSVLLNDPLGYLQRNVTYQDGTSGSQGFCRHCRYAVQDKYVSRLNRHTQRQHDKDAVQSDFLKFDEQPLDCMYENWKEFINDPQNVQLKEKECFKFKRTQRKMFYVVQDAFCDIEKDSSDSEVDQDFLQLKKNYLYERKKRKEFFQRNYNLKQEVQKLNGKLETEQKKYQKLHQKAEIDYVQYQDEKTILRKDLEKQQRDYAVLTEQNNKKQHEINEKQEKIDQLIQEKQNLQQTNDMLKITFQEMKVKNQLKLDYYEAVKNEKVDKFFEDERSKLIKEFEEKTQEIHQKNIYLFNQNQDLKADISTRDEMNKVLKSKIEQDKEFSFTQTKKIIDLEQKIIELANKKSKDKQIIEVANSKYEISLEENKELLDLMMSMYDIVKKIQNRLDIGQQQSYNKVEIFLNKKGDKYSNLPEELSKKLQQKIEQYEEAAGRFELEMYSLKTLKDKLQIDHKKAESKNKRLLKKNKNQHEELIFLKQEKFYKNDQMNQCNQLNQMAIDKKLMHAKDNQEYVSVIVKNPCFTEHPSEYTASPSDKLSKFDPKKEEFNMIKCQVKQFDHNLFQDADFKSE